MLSCSACGGTQSGRIRETFAVAPHVRLWLECTGRGPVVLADGALSSPTRVWDATRRDARNVRFCAFDRAGVGRSAARPCRCGSLEQNVEEMHALIGAAGLKTPLILAGSSTGGLDDLLYARRYPKQVSALVLVDSPSESAPPPPGPLDDGKTKLDFRSGLRELRSAPPLRDLPTIVLSHGRTAFSTAAAERSWTRMQRELVSESSRSVRIIALTSRHLIQVDQPQLVATAIEEAARGGTPRCVPAYDSEGGDCD